MFIGIGWLVIKDAGNYTYNIIMLHIVVVLGSNKGPLASKKLLDALLRNSEILNYHVIDLIDPDNIPYPLHQNVFQSDNILYNNILTYTIGSNG